MAEGKNTFSADGIINQMGSWFLKLPALPKGAKDFIVMVIPWVALVFGVLGLLGSLTALGIGTFLSPLVLVGGGIKAVSELTISVLIGLVVSVITLIAVKPLLGKKEFGWKVLFWGEALSTVGAIVTLSLMGLVFSFIWFYILFQIKSLYK